MTVRVLLLLLVAVWLPAVWQQELGTVEEAELIVALRNHFHSSCIFLLYSASSYSPDSITAIHLLQLQYLLGAKGIATASVAISSYGSHPSGFQCRQGRPLNVVLSGLPSPSEQLQQVFSKRVKVSYPRWLLLSSEPVTTYVPFNCELLVATRCGNLVCLAELFQVSLKLPLQTVPWGKWSSGLPIEGPTRSLYQRRADLQGVELKAAAIDDPPMEVLVQTTDGRIESHSFFTLVWSEIQHRINCTTRIVQAEDNVWGSVGANGRWGGMVGMLQRGEVDLSFSSFIMTSTRTTALDYTVPLVSIRAGVFVRAPGATELRWQAFLEPFSSGLWLATVGSILVMGLYLSLLHTIGLKLGYSDSVMQNYHLDYSLKSHLAFGVDDCFFYIWGGFCSQGHEISPRLWACRIILWTAMLCAGTLLAAYSANFTASLAVGQADLPFTTLEELLEDGSHQLGVVANGGMYSVFQNASTSLLQKVYHELLLPHANALPNGYREGFARVCTQHRYAFMDFVDNAITVRAEIPCALTELPQASFSQHSAMALIRDSPYRGLINHHLLELHRLGIIHRLSLVNHPVPPSAPDTSPHSVTMHGAMPVLCVWAAGVLLSSLALLIENRRYLHAGRAGHIATAGTDAPV